MKLYTTPEDRQIATLTAEVSRLTGERDARVSGENHKAAIDALEDTMREVCAENASLRAERDKYYQQVINVGAVAINSIPQEHHKRVAADLERSRQECEGLREAIGRAMGAIDDRESERAVVIMSAALSASGREGE